MPQIIFLSIIATTMISTILPLWDELSKCQELKIVVLFWSPFLAVGGMSVEESRKKILHIVKRYIKVFMEILNLRLF